MRLQEHNQWALSLFVHWSAVESYTVTSGAPCKVDAWTYARTLNHAHMHMHMQMHTHMQMLTHTPMHTRVHMYLQSYMLTHWYAQWRTPRAAYYYYFWCTARVSATSLLKLCIAHSSSRLRIVCEPQWIDIHGTTPFLQRSRHFSSLSQPSGLAIVCLSRQLGP